MDANTEHRPWPLPLRPWVMAMRWSDLLFMHWPVAAAQVRPMLPPTLELETWNGNAWIAVVPFRMSGVRLRGLPPLPGLSAFPELNVRTYVTSSGKAGVWFFSLDATNSIAITAARHLFHLPYHRAEINVRRDGGSINYRSRRLATGGLPATLRMTFAPIGGVVFPVPGTLEHWLTERYCLYAADPRGRLWRGEIHHQRWPLQPARATLEVNTMTAALGLTLPDSQPLLHFARRLDAVAWKIRAV